MSQVTRFGPNPTQDLEVANKAYVDAGGGGGGVTLSNQSVIQTSNFTTTSTSFVDVTGLTITLANRANGMFWAAAVISLSLSSSGATYYRFVNGATDEAPMQFTPSTTNHEKVCTIILPGDLDGDVLKVQARVSGNTLTVWGSASLDRQTQERVIEIS